MVGLLLALLVTVRVPVRDPAAVGWNATLTVQLAPTAMLLQLLVCVKSPVTATPETVAALRTGVGDGHRLGGRRVPTTVPAKDRLDGLGLVIGPGATPVPVRLTLVGVPPTVTASVPVWAPEVVGLKVTLYERRAVGRDTAAAGAWCPRTSAADRRRQSRATRCRCWTPSRSGRELVVLVACEPKDSDVGVTLTLLSGRYGGKTGVGLKLTHWVGVMPRVASPSVMTKLPPSQLYDGGFCATPVATTLVRLAVPPSAPARRRCRCPGW